MFNVNPLLEMRRVSIYNFSIFSAKIYTVMLIRSALSYIFVANQEENVCTLWLTENALSGSVISRLTEIYYITSGGGQLHVF